MLIFHSYVVYKRFLEGDFPWLCQSLPESRSFAKILRGHLTTATARFLQQCLYEKDGGLYRWGIPGMVGL